MSLQHRYKKANVNHFDALKCFWHIFGNKYIDRSSFSGGIRRCLNPQLIEFQQQPPLNNVSQAFHGNGTHAQKKLMRIRAVAPYIPMLCSLL